MFLAVDNRIRLDLCEVQLRNADVVRRSVAAVETVAAVLEVGPVGERQ